MAKDRERNGKEEGTEEEEEEEEAPLKKDQGRKPKRRKESESDDDEQSSDHRKHSRSHKKKKKRSRSSKRSSRSRRYSDEDSSSSSYYSSDASDSEMSGSDSESDGPRETDSEDERRRRRKRKEKKREYEKEKRRKRREKEKKKLKKEKERKERKKKKGPVTNSWGKYGIIRETDMWNKRPEFTAWLSEIKKVNLETIPSYEEKLMFKEFMEDHNTATFPSKKYYNLDAYHRHKIEKEIKKGVKKLPQAERTIFNDEEQRRLELMQVREKQKEQEVETLKRAMQSGMAQAMKEQAQLREEMAYQYKLGNFEAAAAIQRRLDPDVAM